MYCGKRPKFFQCFFQKIKNCNSSYCSNDIFPVDGANWTIYTGLNEKGKVEGKLKGKLEVKTEVVFRLLDERFETAKILKIIKMREEEVVNILKDNNKLA